MVCCKNERCYGGAKLKIVDFVMRNPLSGIRHAVITLYVRMVPGTMHWPGTLQLIAKMVVLP